jgi:teichuronic acid biosynthesis glycosyltransferase TuaG
MSAPLVSIVMPAYNAEATLQDSISSVLAQTLPDWELLLVVDCKSADSTRTLAEKAAAKESRIRLITDLTEGGCVFNRNEAIARATGEFIAFLDSDDLWMPEKLQKQVSHMQQTGSGLSYTGYKQMDWEGNLLNHIIQPPPRLTHSLLLHDNLLGCLTAMLRRSRHGGERFVEHLHEDYILWLKLLRQEDALGLPEPLAIYRMAAHSRSGNKKRAATARWRILRNYEKLSLPRALYYFASYAWRASRKRL